MPSVGFVRKFVQNADGIFRRRIIFFGTGTTITTDAGIAGESVSRLAAETRFSAEGTQGLLVNSGALLEAVGAIEGASPGQSEALSGVSEDGVPQAEWLGAINTFADVAMPIEVEAAIDGSVRFVGEIGASLSVSETADVESASRAGADGAAISESLGAIGKDEDLQVEYGGDIGIVSDAPLPVESLRVVSEDAPAVTGVVSRIFADGLVLAEILGTIQGTVSLTMEALLRAASDAGIPSEQLTSLSRGEPVQIELLGIILSILADADLQLEFERLYSVFGVRIVNESISAPGAVNDWIGIATVSDAIAN